MADSLPGGLVLATQVARETEVRRSSNGVHFATFGETGVADLDLDRMLEAVPTTIVSALKANTYYFVPLALREPAQDLDAASQRKADQPMVARSYTEEFSDAAICHRNVELGHGNRGIFISTRLMGDRFALCFEFFINVAHAFVDEAGVPASFADLAWQQAVANVRGETSLDAWESRNLAFGRPANGEPEAQAPRRNRAASQPQRSFAATLSAAANPAIDEREKTLFLEAGFSDAIAIYLLSLAMDFDYGELREREYPLLAPAALAARLKLVAELFPPNAGYEFAVKYRRRA
ncbi:hypothetical protein SAMN05421819_2075 [Bryocella elongata]|uniref:Uncharacterized protein n=1 Tax=Bryocella elongata TaxID=863522 RepID=A0A1H5Y2R7_9BACT|nr:hypothetical protein [Bryocella elongata]SEG17846.1 hypothetical protein SAMN05421819_2075 [Bryocella elongata]